MRGMTTASVYAEFAARETRGISPVYERLSIAVSRDDEMLCLPVIEEQMRSRATQTNEPGRCAVLLPVLAALPQPLALLDVGASAGLCLYPDRYSYRYGDHQIGAGDPLAGRAGTGRRDLGGVPHIGAVPGAAAAAGVVHRGGTRAAGSLDRERGSGRARLPGVPAPPGQALQNVLSLDGTPLAWNRSHGQALTWFG
jgi:hypothetical protein